MGSAVSRNSLNKARLLIKHGANVNARNKNGRTVLHVAAKLDSVDVARLLIEKGAWRNVRSKLGDTPLHQAALKNSLNVARLLIEHGAKIDTKSKADFLPPPPRLDIVVFWKPATLDVAVTPLWWAARCNHLEVTRLLIEKGANTDGIDLSWMDDQEDGSCAE